MKAEILEKLTWVDIKEIDDALWNLTMPDRPNEEYYTDVLNQLKEKAKANTLSPIVNYMIKAVTDAFEAGLNAGMEVLKLVEEQK